MRKINSYRAVLTALIFLILSGCHNLPNVVVPTEMFMTQEAQMKTVVVAQMTEVAVQTVTAQENLLDKQAADLMPELSALIEKDDINGFYKKLIDCPDTLRPRLKSFVLSNLYDNLKAHKVIPPKVDLSDNADLKKNFYPDINDELFKRYETYQSILELFHFDLSDGGNELLDYSKKVLALKTYKNYVPAFRFYFLGHSDDVFDAYDSFNVDNLSTARTAYDRMNRLNFEGILRECKFTRDSYGYTKITRGFESIRTGLNTIADAYSSSNINRMQNGLQKCIDGLTDFESLLTDDFIDKSSAFERAVPVFPDLDLK